MNQGIDWAGPNRQACPSCARGPKDRALSVTVDERGGVAHCFRCGYVETIQGETRAGSPKRSAARPKHESLSDYGRELWEACRPISGEARAYLHARQCVIPPNNGDLRWYPALKHPPSGRVGPALVALVTDAVSRKPLTLHRTWVRADGSKAEVDPPRMLLGGHRKAGGVVRLWPDAAVGTLLCVTEGIETALTAARKVQPVWSCIDAGNLATLAVVGGIERLVIAADNDPTGIAAGTACRTRWRSAGVRATLRLPKQPGHDFNDEERACA